MFTFHGSCVVHVEAVLRRGEVIFRVVVVRLCIPDAGDGVKGEVVGEDLVFMGLQGWHEARVGCLVGWREVDEERDVDHVVVERGRCVVVFHVLAVVGEVDHGLEVQVLLRVFEDVADDFVVIGNGQVIVMVRVAGRDAEFVSLVDRNAGEVGVVAAVDVDEDDAFLGRQKASEL